MRKFINISLLVITCFLFISFLLGILYIYSSKWENGLFYKPLSRLKTTQRVVALTFDDGPSEKRTPLLLDLLKKHDIKATFFMIGKNIENFPIIAKQVVGDGHLIGNHSYNHPKLVFKSIDFIENQIVRTDQLIESIGQSTTIFFRPPYSAKFIFLPFVLHSLNKVLVTGSYDPPSEYIRPFNSRNVAREIIENTKPGSIIYLHDGSDIGNEDFFKAVETVIIELKSLGYSFVRIDYKEQEI